MMDMLVDQRQQEAHLRHNAHQMRVCVSVVGIANQMYTTGNATRIYHEI
jgi:hypothetical protein